MRGYVSCIGYHAEISEKCDTGIVRFGAEVSRCDTKFCYMHKNVVAHNKVATFVSRYYAHFKFFPSSRFI